MKTRIDEQREQDAEITWPVFLEGFGCGFVCASAIAFVIWGLVRQM